MGYKFLTNRIDGNYVGKGGIYRSDLISREYPIINICNLISPYLESNIMQQKQECKTECVENVNLENLDKALKENFNNFLKEKLLFSIGNQIFKEILNKDKVNVVINNLDIKGHVSPNEINRIIKYFGDSYANGDFVIITHSDFTEDFECMKHFVPTKNLTKYHIGYFRGIPVKVCDAVWDKETGKGAILFGFRKKIDLLIGEGMEFVERYNYESGGNELFVRVDCGIKVKGSHFVILK